MLKGIRVLDSHVHLWEAERPDRLRTRQLASHVPDTHLVEDFIRVMSGAGGDALIQVTPTHVGYDNRYSLEAAERFPAKVFVFGRFDFVSPHPRKRLEEWLSQSGAKGIRVMFFNTPVEVSPTSKVIEPFWQAAEDLRLPVAVYAPTVLNDVVTVLNRHPRLVLLIDHMGLGLHPVPDPFAGLEQLTALAQFSGVRMKISGLCELSREPFPFPDIQPHVKRAFDIFGAERLIWGSDSPYVAKRCTYEESLRYLEECDFIDPGDLEWVLGRTARDLLQIS
jgi:predicted TIM-barrel fold metal-dependent hydrolase